MVSSFSNSLRLELIETGDQSGIWGVTTNGNLGTLLEQAIAGVETITHTNAANLTLTAINGAVDQARNAVIIFDGALTANRNVVVPTQEKVYIVRNSTTGGFSLTVKTAAGTGVAVANGGTAIVYCDGTNVESASGAVPAGSIDTTELADDAVTEPKLANDAVTLDKIADAAQTSLRTPNLLTDTNPGVQAFPVGSYILVSGTAPVDRNSSDVLFLNGGVPSQYSQSGVTQLTGTWRARGEAVGGTGVRILLYQRIS